MTTFPTYTATVLRAADITPRLRCVTVAIDGFQTRDLPDERIKLTFPGPVRRTFTVRRHEGRELDIEFAIHDGPAVAWAYAARPGDELGVLGPSGGYEPGARGGRHLILGDESALPGIATILDRLPPDAVADVVVEVGDPAAELALGTAATARVRWVGRGAAPASARLVEAVLAFEWPEEPVAVWAAGESLAMRSIRRHLRDELALPRERLQAVGYWRDRFTEDESIEAHLAGQEKARAAGASEDEIHDAGIY